jgi:rRNA-processing protein FCF1
MENRLSTLDEIGRYCSSHPGANLVVDTSALLLFLVGIYSPDYIGECPFFTENGKFYRKEDFELVWEIFKRFPNKIVVTPHVVSEINMLSKKIGKDRRSDYFRKVIQELERHKERCIPLKILLKNGAIIEFGFTDMSLIEIAEQNQWMILTDDLPLYMAFNSKVPMINLNSVIAAGRLNGQTVRC